jgi:class 3 adenylate cyclase
MANDIVHWLEDLGLGKYGDAFIDNEVSVRDLAGISNEDLKELGLPLGPRRRILIAVEALQRPTPEAGSPSLPALADSGEKVPRIDASDQAERRQLTVLFCDLVGSTELSQRLDPEDLREVMRRYQSAVTSSVHRFGGHVAKFLGDGVLVYFGWPQAHEDQVERAIHTGMEAVRAVADISDREEKLQARVGIATGEVVVGNLSGEIDAIVGKTPNLAARLQGVAAPGEVVVDDMTKSLVGGVFDFAYLGGQVLKGIAGRTKAYSVQREAESESRFAARETNASTFMVGREHELALLTDRWRTAMESEGQMVLLSGEPGIGKSRITKEMISEVSQGPHFRINYQCSPLRTNSAFYPIARQLEHAAGFASDDNADSRLDKLEAILGVAGADVGMAAPLLAPILSLPTERYPQLDLSPQQRKEKIYEVLGAQVSALARSKPVLIVLEDAHWIDPTTLEVFSELKTQISVMPVMILVTSRPEFIAPWPVGDMVSALTMTRLSKRQCAELILEVTGGKRVPDEVVEQVMAHSDGNPLYVEELTKTLLEAVELRDDGDHFVLEAPLPSLAIPTSLQASLMARLDRLSMVKDVAQIAACIGREFNYDLLSEISPLNEPVLQGALQQLLDSQIVYRTSSGMGQSYVFKHALLQDSAYQSLLRSRRQELHKVIAEALLRLTPEIEALQPEVLAHHFAEANEVRRAVQYWMAAARAAIAVAGNREAMGFLSQARQALADEPPTVDRNSLEMDAVILFAGACIGSEGYASKNTEEAYLRGRELMSAVPADHRHSAIIYGLFVVNNNLGKHARSVEFAEELLTLAEQHNDAEMLCVAHRSLAVAYNPMGRFFSASEHSKKAVAYHDPNRHKNSAYRYGHDIGVAALWHLALSQLCLGQITAANQARRQAISTSRALKHPTTIAYSLLWHGFFHLMIRNAENAKAAASTLQKYADSRQMAQFEAWGRWMFGAALVVEGLERTSGLCHLDRASKDLAELRVSLMRPAILSFRSEALLALGRNEEAAAAISLGLKISATNAENWYLPELQRHRAALFNSSEEAEAELMRAMLSAADQGALLLELRSAVAVFRVTKDKSSLRKRIESILAGIDAVDGAPDVTDARRLLATL